MDRKPVLSRSGESSLCGGKRTAEAKTKLDEETKAMAESRAKSLGMSLSEWLRDLIIVNTRGEQYLRSVYDRRVRGVATKGHE